MEADVVEGQPEDGGAVKGVSVLPDKQPSGTAQGNIKYILYCSNEPFPSHPLNDASMTVFPLKAPSIGFAA